MERMPVELFLKLIPAPKKLCEEEPRMLATLQTLALNGKRLGELTPGPAHRSGRNPFPAQDREAGRASRRDQHQTERGDQAGQLAQVAQHDGNRGEDRHGGVQTRRRSSVPDQVPPTEDEGTSVEGSGAWRTCRVDTRAGHGVFWRELESTFKGNDGSRERVADGSRKKIQPGVPQTYVTKPDMKGAFPSSRLAKNGLNPEKRHGHLRQEDLVEDEGPHHPPEGRPPRRARQDPAERGGDSRAGGGEARRGNCPYGRKGKRD